MNYESTRLNEGSMNRFSMIVIYIFRFFSEDEKCKTPAASDALCMEFKTDIGGWRFDMAKGECVEYDSGCADFENYFKTKNACERNCLYKQPTVCRHLEDSVLFPGDEAARYQKLAAMGCI